MSKFTLKKVNYEMLMSKSFYFLQQFDNKVMISLN